MTQNRSLVARGGGKKGLVKKKGLPRGPRKLLEVMDMFITLSVVMYSLVYANLSNGVL